MDRQVKRSISVAIPHPDGERVMIVQRPADDADLPNMWGLPAASLKDGETWEDAAQRAGIEKLGVELEVGPEMERGASNRRDYRLEMRLFRAKITRGEVEVPRGNSGVTQYQAWRWGSSDDLEPAARAGSLCCQLYRTAFRIALDRPQ